MVLRQSGGGYFEVSFLTATSPGEIVFGWELSSLRSSPPLSNNPPRLPPRLLPPPSPPLPPSSRCDVLDYLCWALFEGRNQEHLTAGEISDLTKMLGKLEAAVTAQKFHALPIAPAVNSPFHFHRTPSDSLPAFHFSSVFSAITHKREKAFMALPDLTGAKANLEDVCEREREGGGGGGGGGRRL